MLLKRGIASMVGLVGLAALNLFSLAAYGGSQDERVGVSFMLALGRTPTTGELSDWSGLGAKSVEELYSELVGEIGQLEKRRDSVVTRAFFDVFGIEPSGEQLSEGLALGGSYLDLTREYVSRLADNVLEYEATMRRAYRFVINRDAYEEEISYWKERGVFSYVLLVGCIEDWAKRNQPGLMVTAGAPTVSVNSEYLATLRLSPDVSMEAKAAFGFEQKSPLVAVGSAGVASGGQVNFVFVGGIAMVE